MHLSSASPRGGGGGDPGLMWGNMATFSTNLSPSGGGMWGLRFMTARRSGKMWVLCI